MLASHVGDFRRARVSSLPTNNKACAGGYGDARVKDKELAPVVQTLDSAIRQINVYPADNAIGFPNNSDLSGG